jgi:hypothetical protein
MDLRKVAAPRAEALGSGVALVAYIPEGKVIEATDDGFDVPLDSVHMLMLRNAAKSYTYRQKTVEGKESAVPIIVNVNRFHCSDGLVHCGGPKWFMDRRGQVSSEPGKNRRLEGAVVDLREGGTRERYSFVSYHHNHTNLLKWSKAVLDLVTKPDGKGFKVDEDMKVLDGLEIPQFFSSYSGDGKAFLTAREGEEVNQLVLEKVNLKKYDLPCVGGLTSPDNGFVTFDFKKGQYEFHPVDSDENHDIANPSLGVQRTLQKAFGTDHPVHMLPLYPKAKKLLVIEGQSIWTPIKEQAEKPSRHFTFDELKNMPNFEVIRQLCVLGVGSTPDGRRIMVPFELASCRDVWVHFPSGFPLISLVKNVPSAFKSFRADHRVDILDTPIRHDVWARKKEKVAATASK